jgi:hypothetical protein
MLLPILGDKMEIIDPVSRLFDFDFVPQFPGELRLGPPDIFPQVRRTRSGDRAYSQTGKQKGDDD